MTSRYFIPAALMLVVAPCLAHHSFAMFDDKKTVTLQGTVTELQWTNPHCYLQVMVHSGNATAEWSIEMHSPLAMYRFGWKPGSFKPGDKVTVTINPLKDGTHGGRLLTAVDASGRSLGTLRTQPDGKPQS
ncbi:MAG TPA: DUF6152 family protein [Steroidobacteraceae bacterium]